MLNFTERDIKKVELHGLNIHIDFNSNYIVSSMDFHYDDALVTMACFHDLVTDYNLEFHTKINNCEIWLGCNSDLCLWVKKICYMSNTDKLMYF